MIQVGKTLKRLKSCNVEETIVVVVGEGKGQVECCYRDVTYVFNKIGKIIAVNDPYPCECCTGWPEFLEDR